MANRASKTNKILAIIVIAVVSVLILRLAWMQVLQGAQYKKTADANRIRQVTTQAPRGDMYDRNGAVLIVDRPSFAISIIPAEYTNPAGATYIISFPNGHCCWRYH